MISNGLFHGKLPKNRLEEKFKDSKPLFTESEAIIEANRCLFCYDAPCINACPTEIDIPQFIKKIATGNIRGSAKTIYRSNILGYTCARVCPVEVLCVNACVFNNLNNLPIQIGRLQHFATEEALKSENFTGRKIFHRKAEKGKKVALIGAGPASLSCAAYLALEGINPVVFEKDGLPGGLNTTGIAPYKLHSNESLREVEWLLDHGIELKTGVEIGKDVQFDALIKEYDAVFIGIGLGSDKILGIPGEEGPGIWGATDLIKKIKIDRTFEIPRDVKAVMIIGGGNTAIDIARELAMLGVPEVNILYRRTKKEMPGYKHELEGARMYGVRFYERLKPVEIIRENNKIKSIRTIASQSEETFEFRCDWVIKAIGQKKQGTKISTEIKVDDGGRIVVDTETQQTSLPGIYAGGDCINGGKEVVNAVADGRKAAFAILKQLNIND